MTRLARYRKYFIPGTEYDYNGALKQFQTPPPLAIKNQDVKIVGLFVVNYTLYYFSFYLKTLDVKFNGQQILRRKCVFSNSSDSNDRFKEALKYLTLSF